VTILISYGLLLCSGKPQDKAEVFYGVLQEGGIEAHEFICATDKDFVPVIKKMC
jgi:hypothetical protein